MPLRPSVTYKATLPSGTSVSIDAADGPVADADLGHLLATMIGLLGAGEALTITRGVTS
jgi:hypothetical protein